MKWYVRHFWIPLPGTRWCLTMRILRIRSAYRRASVWRPDSMPDTAGWSILEKTWHRITKHFPEYLDIPDIRQRQQENCTIWESIRCRDGRSGWPEIRRWPIPIMEIRKETVFYINGMIGRKSCVPARANLPMPEEINRPFRRQRTLFMNSLWMHFMTGQIRRNRYFCMSVC